MRLCLKLEMVMVVWKKKICTTKPVIGKDSVFTAMLTVCNKLEISFFNRS